MTSSSVSSTASPLIKTVQAEVRYFIETSPACNLASLNALQGEAERKVAGLPDSPDRDRWEYNAAQLKLTIAALLKVASSDAQQIDFDTLHDASKLKALLQEFSTSASALKMIRDFAERPPGKSVLDQIETVKENMATTKVKQALRKVWSSFGSYLQSETSKSNRGLFAEILDGEQLTKLKRWVIEPLEELGRSLQSDAIFTKTSGFQPIFTMGSILSDVNRVVRDKGRQAKAQKLTALLEMFEKEVEPHIEDLNSCRVYSSQRATVPFL